MKKDVFTVWLKEICSLVFIQTIQAFLIAIVMSLIVSTMLSAKVEGDDKSDDLTDSQGAAGIIAIIALASISKMESLVKKIFGIDSSITDTSMKGGAKSLVGTMMAAKLAGKVANNIPNIVGGVAGATVGHSRKVKSADKKLLAGMKRNGAFPASGSNTNGSDATGSNANESDASGSNTNGSNTNGNNTNGASSNAGSGTRSGLSDKARDRMEALKDKYDAEIADARKGRRESFSKIRSGITETAGALVGGTFGAIYGAAEGGDHMVEHTAQGVGVGDMMGGQVEKTYSGVSNVIRDIKQSSRDKEKYISDVLGEEKERLISSSSKNVYKNIKAIRNQKERANTEFERAKRNIDAGNY